MKKGISIERVGGGGVEILAVDPYERGDVPVCISAEEAIEVAQAVLRAADVEAFAYKRLS